MPADVNLNSVSAWNFTMLYVLTETVLSIDITALSLSGSAMPLPQKFFSIPSSNIGSIHFRFYHQARSYDLNLWPCKFLTTNPSIRHQYGLSDRKGIRTVKKIISGNTIQVVVIATNCTLNPLWPKQRTIIQQYGDWYTGR